MRKIQFISLVLFVSLFFSCSMQKRHYRDGFYFASRYKKGSVEQGFKKENRKAPVPVLALYENKYVLSVDTTVLVAKNSVPKDQAGSVAKKTLYSVTTPVSFPKLFFKKMPAGNWLMPGTERKRIPWQTWFAFGCALFFVFICVLTAIPYLSVPSFLRVLLSVYPILVSIFVTLIFGPIGIIKVNREPDKFKGKGLALWAILTVAITVTAFVVYFGFIFGRGLALFTFFATLLLLLLLIEMIWALVSTWSEPGLTKK